VLLVRQRVLERHVHQVTWVHLHEFQLDSFADGQEAVEFLEESAFSERQSQLFNVVAANRLIRIDVDLF